uniref:Uncharacterized protein n=1 Tax=Anser cygnoides TaxID=8845 RepID=A0A8B9E6N6_ANSCY
AFAFGLRAPNSFGHFSVSWLRCWWCSGSNYHRGKLMQAKTDLGRGSHGSIYSKTPRVSREFICTPCSRDKGIPASWGHSHLPRLLSAFPSPSLRPTPAALVFPRASSEAPCNSRWMYKKN